MKPKTAQILSAGDTTWPPLQARSRDTQRRIVEAAGKLLEERSFGDVSVAEIVRGAGCSVGAFYARFRDKDALLDHLIAAYGETLDREVQALEATAAAESTVLTDRVPALIRFYVTFCRRYRGLIRAMLVRARAGGTETQPSLHPEAQRLAAAILGSGAQRAQIAHPDPGLASHLAVAMLTATVRERVVFGERVAGNVPVTDATLIEELSRSCLAYLGS